MDGVQTRGVASSPTTPSPPSNACRPARVNDHRWVRGKRSEGGARGRTRTASPPQPPTPRAAAPRSSIEGPPRAMAGGWDGVPGPENRLGACERLPVRHTCFRAAASPPRFLLHPPPTTRRRAAGHRRRRSDDPGVGGGCGEQARARRARIGTRWGATTSMTTATGATRHAPGTHGWPRMGSVPKRVPRARKRSSLPFPSSVPHRTLRSLLRAFARSASPLTVPHGPPDRGLGRIF